MLFVSYNKKLWIPGAAILGLVALTIILVVWLSPDSPLLAVSNGVTQLRTAAEQHAEHDVGDSVEATWVDSIWIACVILFNVFYFGRKLILVHYGYPFKFHDLGYERGYLAKVAAGVESRRERKFLKAVNILIPLLFTLAVLVLLAYRGIPMFFGG